MTLPQGAYPQAFIANEYCLGEIADFQGLLPKAYDAGVPVFELTSDEIHETGPVLAQMTEKRNIFFNQFTELVGTLVTLLAHV